MNGRSPHARIGGAIGLVRRIVMGTVGTADYEAYLARHREIHPDAVPMDYPTFFRERQNARYDGAKGNSRCC
ncbi:YbdD/YjiX family protein [Sphingosinicella rhizophila]|uniref:YbdD/YjiX family protein n=1 Tax=Sphingosinicella rhizophila TaxID=3050082 RepID=A0ABU3QCV7_9SPHN|nr:YbdD/YjiX family protein [Sphingosinicella sp. GR2756]MDT9600790.1 YbdD/YjiX family protein [Sphingosinicella sp. GR2756]